MGRVRTGMLAFLTAVLATSALAAPVAAATTRYVDDDGRAGPKRGCDGSQEVPRRIQPAIDASGPFDTVLVCPGVYRGRIVIDGTAKEGMNLFGTTASGAIIRPPDPSRWRGGSLLTVRGAGRVWLKRLRLEAPTAGDCRRIVTMVTIGPDSPDTEVLGLRIVPKGRNTIGRCGYHRGIWVRERSPSWLDSNRVRDFRDSGIVVERSGDDQQDASRVTTNRVRYRHAAEGRPAESLAGISVASDGSSVLDNDVLGAEPRPYPGRPGLDIGIHLDGRMQSASGNTVRYARVGIDTELVWSATLAWGLYLARNVVLDTRVGIRLDWVLDGTVAGNRVRRSDVGIEVIGPGPLKEVAMRIRDNDLRGNALACSDDSRGVGTAGTAHRYQRNLGSKSEPRRICD